MTITTRDPWDGTEATYASTVFEEGSSYETNVLDSYGNPYVISKPKQPIGFKLTKENK